MSINICRAPVGQAVCQAPEITEPKPVNLRSTVGGMFIKKSQLHVKHLSKVQ